MWGVAGALAVVLLVVWFAIDGGGNTPAPPDQPQVLRLAVKVLRSHPHDTAAFTQGLLWHQGKLYESTGQYGSSSLRRVDLRSGQVEVSVDLAPQFFGEGLARIEDRLLQLTWREGTALAYEVKELRETGRYAYSGQGWGLCWDGRTLFMSDGSHVLTLRDPESFAVRGRVSVTMEGEPLSRLNELECAEGWVYANVWQTDTIVRIDPQSGEVRAVIDAGGLLDPGERAAAGVLNGIAYDSERGVFLLTGKQWPRLFEVVFGRAAEIS
jgi:glutaminyl-peptide cyclotransferase